MTSSPNLNCLIIAAGKGSRLSGKGPSKPLVHLLGKPLIEWVIDGGLRAGLERFTIVTGYRGKEVRAHLDALAEQREFTVTHVINEDYEQPNGLSVLAARQVLDGPYILTMCDHIVDPKLLDRMIAIDIDAGSTGLGVDRRLDNPDIDLDDVTRVRTEGVFIRDIGKGIPSYTAYDTGIFRADDGLMEAIAVSASNGDASLSGGMAELAKQDRAIAVDIEDSFWIDVDDPAAFARAESGLTNTNT